MLIYWTLSATHSYTLGLVETPQESECSASVCVCVRACVCVSEVLTLVSLAVTLIAEHLATSRQADPFMSLQPPRALAPSLQLCVRAHLCVSVWVRVCVCVCSGAGVKPDLSDLFWHHGIAQVTGLLKQVGWGRRLETPSHIHTHMHGHTHPQVHKSIVALGTSTHSMCE